MPYHREDHAEIERRSEAARHRLTSCMNDTKWREVFQFVAQHRLQFQVAWIQDQDWDCNGLHEVCAAEVDIRGLSDPGIGGPCRYRDILWIRIPAAIHEPYFGKVPQRQPIERFLAHLARLGLLPVRQTQEYVEVCGYRD